MMTLVTPIQPKQTNCEVQKRAVNEHLAAAARMSANLPHLLTRAAKRMQQKGILRELLAGLRTGSK